MSTVMEEEIKRWTAKRKSALVIEILQGKTTVAEASRAFDLPPSEIEGWNSPPSVSASSSDRLRLSATSATSQARLAELFQIIR
jgi:transposase-like protein